MRCGLVGIMFLAVAVGRAATVNAQAESPRLRPESEAIRTLINHGSKASATFRNLSSQLDNSDVIVYVRFSSCLTGVSACLLWASTSANTRRLLVKIDRFGRSPDELTALLAHELQHANEVAADHAITDLESFERAFEAHGWRHHAGFETEAAAAVSKNVASELSRGAKQPLRARR